jgi:P-type Mg2+ transporter
VVGDSCGYCRWPALVTILTAMFMHAGWVHIISNMVFLWAFGPEIEEAMDRLRYLVFYLLSGAVASLAQIAAMPASTVPNLGASGAIAGVMGAFLITYPRDEMRTLILFGWFARITLIPAALLIGLWFVIQFFSEVGAVASVKTGGVAYVAHIGGFIFGAISATPLSAFCAAPNGELSHMSANADKTRVAIAGLTAQEAEARLDQFGPNEPAAIQHRSFLSDLWHAFTNPLVLILVIAATVSGFLGERVDAAIIGVIVLLSTAIDLGQTYRSQRAVEKLRAQVAPTATVLRDGEWKELRRHDLVPEDIVRLSAGDLVPADARLLIARDLYVQQAALTGESLPAEKEATGDPASITAEARNMVFLGTSVVSGTATAEVVATGARTAFGDIAARLGARQEETAFDQGLRKFSQLLARTVLFLVLFLIIVSCARHRDPLQSLLFAVALAVGLTPEFLPMITSVTLSKGAVAMAHKQVIVKHLSAIQNLGSLDVLCSDKTGTLTAGTMSLDRSLDPFGNPSQRTLELAYVNSKFETGIRSPLDDVILRQLPPKIDDYTKCDEIPFDFERRRLSVVVERQSHRVLITKGAPEGIFSLLSGYEIEGKAVPIGEDATKRMQQTSDELNNQGFRSLAVAYVEVPARADYSVNDERNLILAGFLSFADEPLADASQVLASLKQDGVEMKVVSGDNDRVTGHVCGQVGIDPGQIVTGEEMDKMTDPALAHVAEQTHAFARISPRQKNRILLALKHNGHAVGFMGDGINDAPSLHAADVGISVSNAVDVAREAADVVLVEPGLRVLHDGIIEGRKAFGNVMKYLLMGTSSNFGNVLSMAGASLFLPFLPMLPTQILLNNLLYDLAQLTIPTDNVDETYLQKPQHWDISLIRNFMVYIGPISSIFDFLTFYVLLHVFRASEAQFHTGWFVESLATQTLVLFVIRTAKNPLRSRPSGPLIATCLAAVAIGICLPFSPLAGMLGFTALPARYFAFLAVATGAYLLLVEAAKQRLLRKTLATNSTKGETLAIAT